jgi:hypothetical protein
MVSDGKCSGSNTGSTRSRHRRRLSIPRAAPWRRGGRSVAECVTSLAQSRGAARRRAARRTACGSAVNQPGHEQRGGDGCGQHQRGREDQPAQRRLPSRRPAHRPMAGGRSEARRRPEIGRPVLLATGRLPVVAFAFASHPPSIATISNAAHPRHGGRQAMRRHRGSRQCRLYCSAPNRTSRAWSPTSGLRACASTSTPRCTAGRAAISSNQPLRCG